MKKYKMLKREENGLCRIQALKDFGDVAKGDIGGFIRCEGNLSHEGNCWVYNDAKIYDDAYVSSNARIFNNAEISGNALVCGDSGILNNAEVCGEAKVFGRARVCGNARVCDNAHLHDRVAVVDNAQIYGSATIRDDVMICDNAEVCGLTSASGEAKIGNNAKIFKGKILGDISQEFDNILFIQCSKGMITIYSYENEVYCNIGCQEGLTLEQLEQRIQDDGGMKPHRQEYINIMKCGRILLGLE